MSRTVLHPLIFTSALALRGVSECLSNCAVYVKPIYRKNTAVANSAIVVRS